MHNVRFDLNWPPRLNFSRVSTFLKALRCSMDTMASVCNTETDSYESDNMKFNTHTQKKEM